MNTNTGMWKLTLSDFQKGLVMAVFIGILTPVAFIIQAPGFHLATANWYVIGDTAGTGALVGFVGYLVKNFLSNSEGQFLGKVG